MNTNLDPEREEALLKAMLDDEAWQAARSAIKARAMETLHTRRRIRRFWQWSGGVAAAATAIAGIVLWLGRPAAAPEQRAVITVSIPKTATQPHSLTDAELIASFPRGSCFIAEVDGKKQLIFLDPRLERAYMARTEW